MLPIILKLYTDLQSKSMDWFLYDEDLHYKRVKRIKHLTEPNFVRSVYYRGTFKTLSNI